MWEAGNDKLTLKQIKYLNNFLNFHPKKKKFYKILTYDKWMII